MVTFPPCDLDVVLTKAGGAPGHGWSPAEAGAANLKLHCLLLDSRGSAGNILLPVVLKFVSASISCGLKLHTVQF